jgi:glutaredoxin
MRRLTLYGQSGCHLCDEARDLLTQLVASDPGLELVEVDIAADPGLLKCYLERIPVIELEGRVIGELVPDPRALRAALLHTSSA